MPAFLLSVLPDRYRSLLSIYCVWLRMIAAKATGEQLLRAEIGRVTDDCDQWPVIFLIVFATVNIHNFGVLMTSKIGRGPLLSGLIWGICKPLPVIDQGRTVGHPCLAEMTVQVVVHPLSPLFWFSLKPDSRSEEITWFNQPGGV